MFGIHIWEGKETGSGWLAYIGNGGGPFFKKSGRRFRWYDILMSVYL